MQIPVAARSESRGVGVDPEQKARFINFGKEGGSGEGGGPILASLVSHYAASNILIGNFQTLARVMAAEYCRVVPFELIPIDRVRYPLAIHAASPRNLRRPFAGHHNPVIGLHYYT